MIIKRLQLHPGRISEELTDEVWEAWDKGEIDGQVAWLMWWLIKSSNRTNPLLQLGNNNDKAKPAKR